jgi:hypothetical protein
MPDDYHVAESGVFDLLDCRSHTIGNAHRAQVAGYGAVAGHVHR